MKKLFPLLLCFLFYFNVGAQELPVGHVDNFAKVDDKVFRGAQPDPTDFVGLKQLGINTVINLRDDPRPDEKGTVESLGMKYINIPMSGVLYPREKDVQRALKLLNESSTGKVFVHCKAGIHRTGVIIAVYRIHNYCWSYRQAEEEMHDRLWFGFSAIWHTRLRTYVKDYAERKTVVPCGMKAQYASLV